MNRYAGLGLAVVIAVLAAAMPTGASAELEGVRDCGDVDSATWVWTAAASTHRHTFWVVFAGKGIGPSCNFARKWAKLGVRKAVAPASRKYRRQLRSRVVPRGWRCTVQSAPEPVVLTGGILSCLQYRGRKLVGSFSATPDLDIVN